MEAEDWKSRHDSHRAYRRLAENDPRIDYIDTVRRCQNPKSYGFLGFERTRSLFVHIPKTGGVSIARALYGGLAAGHLSVRDYEIALSAEEYESYFRFTFVRNPWDRLYSAYTYLISGGMTRQDRLWARRHLSSYTGFEHFVSKGLAVVLGEIHFMPQTEFLKSAISLEFNVHFIGRYETLENDFDMVRAVVNPSARLGHYNRTRRSAVSYRNVYSSRMIEQVGAIYREDIEAFGYSFDGEGIYF